MTVRANFVQRRGGRRKLAPALALFAALGAASGAVAQTLPPVPTLALRARRFEPGEIVRVVAQRKDCRVVSATGTFLGREFALAPSSGPEATPSWVGWAVIPLDQKPGTANVAVKLECGPDLPFMKVDRDVTIAPKTFPEQRLTVEEKFVNPPKSAEARIERERKETGAIYARRSVLPPPTEPFVRPVPGEPTSEFGTRRFFNGVPRAPHPGIDLQAASGTPVAVSGPGKVALAKELYYSGNTVIVDHGEGLFTVYAHLSKIETKPGAAVAAGDRIGLSGATGRVTGPHLHWGARVGDLIFDPRAMLDPKVFR
jgi:peptidase M23-like protein